MSITESILASAGAIPLAEEGEELPVPAKVEKVEKAEKEVEPPESLGDSFMSRLV